MVARILQTVTEAGSKRWRSAPKGEPRAAQPGLAQAVETERVSPGAEQASERSMECIARLTFDMSGGRRA